MESGHEEQKVSVDTFQEENEVATRLENPASPAEIAERGSQLEVALFTQTFYCQDKRELKEHTLSITPNYLMADDQASTNISLQNIIGASVAKVPPMERSNLRGNNLPQDLFSLTVHAYAKVFSKSFFGGSKQVRKAFDLVYYTTDEKLANDWRNLILQSANTPLFTATARQYGGVDQIPRFKRLLLVFVNPHSGKKLGPARWAIGKQFLIKAGCEFTEVFTEYSGHARDYVTKPEVQELLKFDGIVTVSGDGLPHEVINGLLSRPDFDQIKHIPIGPLPGGSGNAIVKNLLSRAGEETSVNNACYLIAKGKPIHGDVTVIDIPGKPPVYSFLSFVWAAMAHIDIDSEVIRWMGAFRFDLFGALSIVKMKKYRAKLTYSQHTAELPPLDEEITGDDWIRSDEDFTYFCLHKMPYITDADLAAPIKDFQDGYNHLISLKGPLNTRAKMTKLLLGLGSGMLGDEEKIKKAGIYYDKVKAFRLEVPNVQNNFYSVDGEKYESNKVQGYIREKALTYFCTK